MSKTHSEELSNPNSEENELLNQSLQPAPICEDSNVSDESSTYGEDPIQDNIELDDFNCFLEFPKDNNKNIDDEAKRNCKILKFVSVWSIDEILTHIKELDPMIYQHLFIVIVEIESLNFMTHKKRTVNSKGIQTNEQKLRKVLEKFSENRPMILQITFINEAVSKYYFKNWKMRKFQKIRNNSTNFQIFTDFPSFFWIFHNFFHENFEKSMEMILNLLPNVKHSSLIYRFLTAFDMDEDFFLRLMLGCARNGSKNDIMAIMNFPLYDKIEELNPQIEDFFAKVDDIKKSFLGNSIENKNKDAHDFIIKCCAKMIGKFPYSFQVAISTTAFQNKQFDYLCDLIDFCDFPFPKDSDVNAVTHDRLKNLIEERNVFNEDIKKNNAEKIDKFIKEHASLKFIYNLANSSALHQAISAKQIQLLYRLESLGLISPEYHDYCKTSANKNGASSAKRLAIIKRKRNVESACKNSMNTVLALSMCSFIHATKNISVDTEAEYRNFIHKWLNNIYNDADNKPHLDLVAQCENLKMVFDFQSDEVINIDPLTTGSNGIMYPKTNWIFIGAKTTSENVNREDEIEGVLAHETSHLAMLLRYENNCHPYFIFNEERKNEFKQIVNDINLWNHADDNVPDDECDGIISSVFRYYDKKDFDPELIVRVVQIRAVYARDKDKLNTIEKKYKPLFDYHRKYIIPDMRNFNLKNHVNIRRFNECAGLVEAIKKYELKLTVLKNTNKLVSNNFTKVTTNSPSLLLFNIYNEFFLKYNKLIETKFVFVDIECLENTHMCKELNQIIVKSPSVNIIIDCTKRFSGLKNLTISEKSCFTLIFLNGKQNKELENLSKGSKTEKLNYSWSDLTLGSQCKLLTSKVNFFGNQIGMQDLYCKTVKNPNKSENNTAESESGPKNLSFNELPGKIDDEIFSLLVQKSSITIGNSSVEDLKNDKYFDNLFMPRSFTRYTKNEASGKSEEEEIDIMQDKLLDDVENKMIVLVSGVAGDGKSWIIKKIVQEMIEKYPAMWTILVDLKELIRKFKLFRGKSINFSTFVIEDILKLVTSYEEEIFHKMYKNGKICIFFDGFDEIAPDYVEYAIKLFKSFVYNDGNQMWIATRDNYEEDLRKNLGLRDVYKLKPFADEDGVNLVTLNLVLNEMEANKQLKKIENLKEHIKGHKNYSVYNQKAIEMNKMIRDLENKSIGLPLFFQMIGDIFSTKDISQLKLTVYEIFEEFMKTSYGRWSILKGELRQATNSAFQLFNYNYFTFHQFAAMKLTYPQKDSFCGLGSDIKKLSEEEIVACGLIIKRGEMFRFLYETFREFFVAQFLLRILRNDLKYADEEFFGYMKDIMLELKFDIVRIFINDAMHEDKIAEKIIQMIPKIAEDIKNLDFILDITKNNLGKLEAIWSNYFKSLNYDDLRSIIFKDKSSILKVAFNKEVCRKFKHLPHASLNSLDLSELMKHVHSTGDNFIHLVIWKNEVETIKNVIENLEKLLNEAQLREISTSKGEHGHNLLQMAASVPKEKKVHEYLWNFIKKSCESDEEFLKLVKEVDFQDNNLLQIVANFASSDVLTFIIEELENLIPHKDVRELLKSTGMDKENLLQIAACRNKFLDHQIILWKTMRKYFNPNEMLDMIKHRNIYDNNLLHVAIYNKNYEVVKQIWTEVQKTVEDEQNKSAQLQEILRSKGQYGRNLIQSIACCSKNENIHKFIWNIMKNSYNSIEEFLEILKEVDDYASNFLHLAASFTTSEVFKFMIEELEKIGKVKEFLQISGIAETNLLQSAASKNNSIEFHEFLWAIIQKFFNEHEILQMINHLNADGDNILHCAVYANKKVIAELIWTKIRKYIEKQEDQAEFIKKLGHCDDNLLVMAQENQVDSIRIKAWLENMIAEYEISI